MVLRDFQAISRRTMPVSNNQEEKNLNIYNYALGLTGEAGEVADLIKKKHFHGHDIPAEEIEKELGDVLHYVAGLCTLHDLILEDVAATNIKKLLKRFPNGFNVEDSIKRVDAFPKDFDIDTYFKRVDIGDSIDEY